MEAGRLTGYISREMSASQRSINSNPMQSFATRGKRMEVPAQSL